MSNPSDFLLSAISIHAPRVGSDRWRRQRRSRLHEISIHAPRVGSDSDYETIKTQLSISIHAPRVGSDGIVAVQSYGGNTFQSTLPVWGATSVTTR